MSATGLDLDWPVFSAPALCAETDPDAFYPEKGGSAAAAKQVCERCPAQAECLQYALDRHLVSAWDGIWGGTSPRERQAMLRQRALAATPLELVVDQPADEVDDEPVLIGPVLAIVPDPEPPTSGRTRRPWTVAELGKAAGQLRGLGMTTVEIAVALDVSAARVRSALRNRIAR